MLNYSEELEIPLDVLDAAICQALDNAPVPGWIEFERQQRTLGSVTYWLRQRELGGLGTLKLHKRTDAITEMNIAEPARRLDARQRRHFEEVIAYVDLEVFGAVATDDELLATASIAPELPFVTQPWERVPDEGYDREMLRLWHDGVSAEAIGRQVCVGKRRIHNRLYELRKKYGPEIVPLRIPKHK